MSDKSFEELEKDKEELNLLRKRATTMGLSFHPSIGLTKLRIKVNAAIVNEVEPVQTTTNEEPQMSSQRPAAAPDTPKKKYVDKTPAQLKHEHKERLRKDSARLVRIRVTNMNPNKKEWEGEMYTVSNSVVGTFKRFVPFNTDDGWHVENIIYQFMKEKKCQIFYTVRDGRNNKVRKSKLINELAIELLDPLTGDELKALETKQAMAHNLED